MPLGPCCAQRCPASRAGYRVRSFLGTDRIASILSSIEKRVNLINGSEPIRLQH